MEPDAGGNARSGRNEVSAYPWAAHYVPVPGPHAPLVRELFDQLGIFKDGRWDERHLCHAPQERLFLHGRWQAGFEPQVGPTARDRDHVARFEARMTEFAATGAFTVPMGDEIAETALDTVSMAQWLSREGLDSPWLRWLVDYGCRDDYGARAGDTSAWAAIHYFASRAPQEAGPLTWPEGNGWITRRLLEIVRRQGEDRAGRYQRGARGLTLAGVDAEARWIADAVIFAAPSFLAARILDKGPATPDFQYSPWLTANLTLDRWPSERGAPMAWDNVIVDSPSLGYVVATHQSLRMHIPRTRVDLLLGALRRVATGQPRVAAGTGVEVACHEDSRRPLARASRHSRVREPHRHLPNGPRDDPAHARISLLAGPPHSARARRAALLRALRPQRPVPVRRGAAPGRRRRRPRPERPR